MRRPVLLIFVNAMILLVVFALLTQSLFVVQRLAQARSLSGSVEVQRGGKGSYRALAANEFVKTGDVVRTGTAGQAEFTWADGTRWKVMPGTQIKVKKATSSSMGKSEQSQLELSSGKVFVRIVKSLSPESRFEVETPAAVASVRGTIFSVEVAGAKTRVCVYKGAVALSPSGGSKTTVAPGEAALVEGSSVATQHDAGVERDFAAQESIVRPSLSVSVRALEGGAALVAGETEAGNAVTINGREARVLGNGAFRFKAEASAGGDGRFTVVARDRHGSTSTWSGSLAPGTSAVPIAGH